MTVRRIGGVILLLKRGAKMRVYILMEWLINSFNELCM